MFLTWGPALLICYRPRAASIRLWRRSGSTFTVFVLSVLCFPCISPYVTLSPKLGLIHALSESYSWHVILRRNKSTTFHCNNVSNQRRSYKEMLNEKTSQLWLCLHSVLGWNSYFLPHLAHQKAKAHMVTKCASNSFSGIYRWKPAVCPISSIKFENVCSEENFVSMASVTFVIVWSTSRCICMSHFGNNHITHHWDLTGVLSSKLLVRLPSCSQYLMFLISTSLPSTNVLFQDMCVSSFAWLIRYYLTRFVSFTLPRTNTYFLSLFMHSYSKPLLNRQKLISRTIKSGAASL